MVGSMYMILYYRSVEEWPWYLAEVYGQDSVLKATNKVATRLLNEDQRQRLETIRWWVADYRK